jgi:signal peptidase I
MRKHLTTVVEYLGAVFLGAIALVLVVTIVVPRVTGTVPLTVLSGSMTPTIPAGSLVFVQSTDPADLGVGDVITWQVPGSSAYVTHRVVGTEVTGGQRVFVTQGDANDGPDVEPVSGTQVRGRVLHHVPHLGRLIKPFQGSGALSVGAVLVGMTIFGWAVKKLREQSTVADVGLVVDPPDAGWAPDDDESLDLPQRGETVQELTLACSGPDLISQEVMVATVGVSPGGRADVVDLVSLLGGRVLDVSHRAVTLSISGTPEFLNDAAELMMSWPVTIVRSGSVALPKLVAARQNATEPLGTEEPFAPLPSEGLQPTDLGVDDPSDLHGKQRA